MRKNGNPQIHITKGPHPNARIKVKPGQDRTEGRGYELCGKSRTGIGTGEHIMS